MAMRESRHPPSLRHKGKFSPCHNDGGFLVGAIPAENQPPKINYASTSQNDEGHRRVRCDGDEPLEEGGAGRVRRLHGDNEEEGQGPQSEQEGGE